MTKEQIEQVVADRIKEEYKKYGKSENIDWVVMAATKIAATIQQPQSDVKGVDWDELSKEWMVHHKATNWNTCNAGNRILDWFRQRLSGVGDGWDVKKLNDLINFARKGATHSNSDNIWWKFDIDSNKKVLDEFNRTQPLTPKPL